MASKVWFLLVAAIVDGGELGAKGEGALLLRFKVLGRGGSVSMVVFLGVVFIIVKDGMIVRQTKGGDYVVFVVGDGSLIDCGCGDMLLLGCLVMGLEFCYWLWAFIFYFYVLIFHGSANSSA